MRRLSRKRNAFMRAFIAFAYIFTNVLFSSDFVERAWAEPSPRPSASDGHDFWRSRALASAVPNFAAPLSAIATRPLHNVPTAPTGTSVSSELELISPFMNVRSIHSRDSQKTVILVQDVHLNPEAQKNIGGALAALINGSPKVVIGAEAARGDFDFKRFRLFPNPMVSKEIANTLVKANRISGVSWAGLTSTNPDGKIIGVDDEKLYLQNLSAFRAASGEKAGAQKAVADLISGLESRRKEMSPELAKLYDTTVTYRKGTTPIGAYLRELAGLAPVNGYAQVGLLLQALDLEKSINNDLARQDRNRLIEALSRDRGALADLTALAAEQTRNPMDPAEFHTRLETISSRHGVDTAKYPAFKTFVRYLALADRIDQEKLFSEIRVMSQDAANRAARTPAERSLFDRLLHARLAERLISFELTPDEWTDYAAGRSTLPAATAAALAPSEKFFEAAQSRDAALATNLLAGMERSGATVAVLVAGGFHSPGAQRFFESKGATVAIVTPKLASVDATQASAYLNAFLRERAPLADLFRSEKLTLADAAQLLGPAPFAGRPPVEASNAVALLQSFAAVQDGTVSADETTSVASVLGEPTASVSLGENGSAVLTVGEMEAEIGPEVEPETARFEDTLGQRSLGVRSRGSWPAFSRRAVNVAIGLGAMLLLTGASGGDAYATIGIVIGLVISAAVFITVVRAAINGRPNNDRVLVSRWWQWLYAWFPTRIMVNGTGRTGVPNILIALHTPGYQLVAANGLENNEDGTTKLEEMAALLEHDEVFGDYGDYRVNVVAAGRAWIDANGVLQVSRNERPDGRTFAGPTTRPSGFRSRIQFMRDRQYAQDLFARLSGKQRDWKRVWASETLPNGESRLEWLDIRVKGRVRRVLFFNARGERTPFFPSRALNIVGMSETSGSALDRTKLHPFVDGNVSFIEGGRNKPTAGNGVQIVVLGAPPKEKKDNIPLIVMGVNQNQLLSMVDIVLSNCSCTTNGGVPLLFALSVVPEWLGDAKNTLLRGHLTTTHGPTVSDQETIDVPKNTTKSGMASGSQTIPTSTGFLNVAKPVLESAGVPVGVISAISFRIPANPSEVALAVDVVGEITIAKAIKIFLIAAGVSDRGRIEALMRGVNATRALRGEAAIPLADVLLNQVETSAAARSPMKGILVLINDEISHSSQFVQSSASTVLNLSQLSVRYDAASNETRVNMYSWYANEWGYAMRTLDALRAFSVAFWQKKGLAAFLRHIFLRKLPAPGALDIAPSAKRGPSGDHKVVPHVEVRQLPDFVTGTDKDIRPTAALVIDGTDKFQLNDTLLYVWNFLRGDRAVDLRIIAGLPKSPDFLAAFAKMLKRPTGFDPLPGKWSILGPGAADSAGSNWRNVPVLRYYPSAESDLGMIEIVLLPSADRIGSGEGVIPPVSHALVLAKSIPESLKANTRIKIVSSSKSELNPLHVPGVHSDEPGSRGTQAMSGRALAAFHMTSALATLPGNRVSQVSVKEIVFPRGEKPIMPRLRGRPAAGNIQMENYSSEREVQKALAARGMTVRVSGETDVVNNQNGSIVQITATLTNDVTRDAIEQALRDYVRNLSGLGYRVVLVSGNEQMFASDGFAGRPAIFINDDVDVSGRMITLSAWFDDRMADVNALNEAARSDFHRPFVDPVVNHFGPVATEPLTIKYSVSRDGVAMYRKRLVQSYGRFGGSQLNLDPLLETPVPLTDAIPYFTRGIHEMEIQIPAGANITEFLQDTLTHVGTSRNVEMKIEPSFVEPRLSGMREISQYVTDLFDRAEREWDGTILSVGAGVLGSSTITERLLPYIPDGRAERYARRLLEMADKLGEGRKGGVRATVERLSIAQREILRRLATEGMPAALRTRLVALNGQIMTALINGVGTWYEDSDYTYGAIFETFAVAERYGVPYTSDAWGSVSPETWARLNKGLRLWFGINSDRPRGFSIPEGGVSFIPGFGYRNFRTIVERLFNDGVFRMGDTQTHAWIFREANGPALSAIWKAIDSSDNASLKSLFYGVAVRYAVRQENLASLLDFATEDPELEPRVLALISVAYQMKKWQFVDKDIPFAFLNYALTKQGGYPMLRFKRMLSDALLSRAPAMLGLPPDGDIKDWAATPEFPSTKDLSADIFDLDTAIARQVRYIGIDHRATEMVEARLTFWRTGSPADAIGATEAYARDQTATWRRTVQPTEPRPIVKRLFELIAEARSAAPDDVLVTDLIRMTPGELSTYGDRLEREGTPRADVERLIKAEIPLYQALSTRYSPMQTNVLSLRAKSASDLMINGENLHKDEYDIDRLVHREIHHGTGEHTLALVEARFEYWRTDNLKPALDAAEKYGPAVTATWRKDPAAWLAAHPTAGKSSDWHPIVRDLFEAIAEIRRVPSNTLRPSVLLSASASELAQARELLAVRYPTQGGLIAQLFDREIALYRALKDRYDPVSWESALDRIKTAGKWPVDIGPLLQGIADNFDPLEKVARLVKVRMDLAKFLIGNPEAQKYNDMGEQADYSYQHGILGVYGFTPGSPHYRAIQLDLALRPIEERLLEEARAVLPKSPSDVTADVIARSAQLMAYAIEIVEATGWATSRLRSMGDMLVSDDMFHQRLSLISDRILQIYVDLDHKSDRERGSLIDAMTQVLSFDTLAEGLVTSLKLKSQADYEAMRLRLRTHFQGAMLRNNVPLFYLKDIALIVRNMLAEADIVPRAPVDLDSRPVAFFPAALFGETPTNLTLSSYSEKGATLHKMANGTLRVPRARETVYDTVGIDAPIPPGIIYPIGMSQAEIFRRVLTDIERLQQAIRDNGLSDKYGDGDTVPMLFAIRSGAIFDAPGQQHTVTNWGITEENAPLLARRIGMWGAWDSLRRYYQEYGMAVYGFPRDRFRQILEKYKEEVGMKGQRKRDLTAEQMKEVASRYKEALTSQFGADAIPASPNDQLRAIVNAIIGSWDVGPMASYRASEGMLHEDGTAIVIEAKVNGDESTDNDSGPVSGAGAAFMGSWPWEEVSGSFSEHAEGSDIADGVITPEPISVLKTRSPELYNRINTVMRALQREAGTKIEVEYTIQKGEFFVLQRRSVPEQIDETGLDAKAVEQAKVLSSGYTLSRRAAVGPLVSIVHFQRLVSLIEKWIKSHPEADQPAARRSFIGDERHLVSRLREIAATTKSGPDNYLELRSARYIADAVATVADLRGTSPLNSSRFGIIVGSHVAAPEDLPLIRYLRDLTATSIVVGAISNVGGPGSHEQENAIHLGLVAVAGTSHGLAKNQILFGPIQEGKIRFERDGHVVAVVNEGTVVSMDTAGSINGRKLSQIYLGALPFASQTATEVRTDGTANDNGAGLTDSVFGNNFNRATRIAPAAEEIFTRFVPLTLVPIALLSLLMPGLAWLSPAGLPITLLVFASGAVFAVIAHAVAHIFVDRGAFAERLPVRLARAARYTAGYLSYLLPALAVLITIAGIETLMNGAASPTISLIFSVVQAGALGAFGVRALARVTAEHAAHNRSQLAAQAVENFVLDEKNDLPSRATAVEFLRAQGLETMKLSEWKRSQPDGATTSAWKTYDTEIDDTLEVAHFNLADLTAANEDSVLGKTAAFRRTLQTLARLSSKNAAVVTVSPETSPDAARAQIADILRQNNVDLPTANALAGIAFDQSERANPFAVAEKFKEFLGGRRLHAMPFQVGSLENWDFTDFLGGNADKVEVLVEIIRLASNESLLMTPSLLTQISAAALIRTQA